MPTAFAPPVASSLVTWGIGALASAALALWMTATWQLAARGVLSRFFSTPPPFLLTVLASVIAAAALGLSPFGRRMALRLPLAIMIGVQAFRLPLELVMHRAVAE